MRLALEALRRASPIDAKHWSSIECSRHSETKEVDICTKGFNLDKPSCHWYRDAHYCRGAGTMASHLKASLEAVGWNVQIDA